jgi:hypothetical protein
MSRPTTTGASLMKNAQAPIADFDAALKTNPTSAESFCGRGLAKRLMGDETGAADIAAARLIDPEITKEFEGYGVRGP